MFYISCIHEIGNGQQLGLKSWLVDWSVFSCWPNFSSFYVQVKQLSTLMTCRPQFHFPRAVLCSNQAVARCTGSVGASLKALMTLGEESQTTSQNSALSCALHPLMHF